MSSQLNILILFNSLSQISQEFWFGRYWLRLEKHIVVGATLDDIFRKVLCIFSILSPWKSHLMGWSNFNWRFFMVERLRKIKSYSSTMHPMKTDCVVWQPR